jgi:hypothetical protein
LTRCHEDDDTHEHFDKLANMRERLSTMDKKYARRQVRIDFDAVVSIAIERRCRFRQNECHIRYFRYRDQLITDEYNRRTLGFVRAHRPKEEGKMRDVKCFNCHRRGLRYRRMLGEGRTVEGGIENADAADIEASVAIEEVDPQMLTLATKKRGGVEVQQYDSGASTCMSPFLRVICNLSLPPRSIHRCRKQ